MTGDHTTEEPPRREAHSWWTTLILIVAVLVSFLVVVALVADYADRRGMISDTVAIPGDRMSPALKTRVASIVGLRPTERIEYFYSASFTTAGDGNLFTNERVISYHVDEGATHVWDADYADIKRLDFSPSDTWIDDSFIEVARTDGEEFVLYVSTGSDLDHDFFDSLMRNWKSEQEAPHVGSEEAAAPD